MADYVDPSIMESGGFTLPWKAHSQGGFQRCDDIMLNIISGVAKSPTAANSAVDVALELAQGTYCRCQGALFVVFTDCSDTRMTRNYVDHPSVLCGALHKAELFELAIRQVSKNSSRSGGGFVETTNGSSWPHPAIIRA